MLAKDLKFGTRVHKYGNPDQIGIVCGELSHLDGSKRVLVHWNGQDGKLYSDDGKLYSDVDDLVVVSVPLTIMVKKATVLVRNGHTDEISLELDAATPFPEMKYPPYADITTREGYGVQWCREVLGIEPEVIKA